MSAKPFAETYASATQSTNLAQDMVRSRPVDVLTAAGMCGRREALGHALMRAQATGNPGDVADARRAMTGHLMAVKRRRPAKFPGMDADMAARIAHAVVSYWRAPEAACPKCSGRGYLLIPGTPTLSDVRCPACGGEGRVSLQKAILQALGASAVDPARWLYGEVLTLAQWAEATMAQTLRR